MIYIVNIKGRKHFLFYFFKQMVQQNQQCQWITAENVFLLRQRHRENAAGMKLQAHNSDNNNNKKPSSVF